MMTACLLLPHFPCLICTSLFILEMFPLAHTQTLRILTWLKGKSCWRRRERDSAKWDMGAILQTTLTDRGLEFEPGADELTGYWTETGSTIDFIDGMSAQACFEKWHPHSAKQNVGDFLKSQILAVLRANSTQEKGWYHLCFLIVLSPKTFSLHDGKQVKKLLEVRSTLQAPLCEFTPVVLHPVKRHFCVRKPPTGSAVSAGFTSFLSPQDLLRPWGVKSVQRRQQTTLERNQRDEAAVI